MASKDGRPGAVRKTKKGPAKGTGGLGRRSLEGKGPTPKAEDRTYHAAGKRKIAKDRLNQAQAKSGARTGTAPVAGRKPKQKHPARKGRPAGAGAGQGEGKPQGARAGGNRNRSRNRRRSQG